MTPHPDSTPYRTPVPPRAMRTRRAPVACQRHAQSVWDPRHHAPGSRCSAPGIVV